MQSVRAAAEGKLGGLEMISWRLKLRPCSRLLVGGAGHKHKDRKLMYIYVQMHAQIQTQHMEIPNYKHALTSAAYSWNFMTSSIVPLD